MPERARPPFRADHVGSLLRPPELLTAREGFKAGQITGQQLSQAEDRAGHRSTGGYGWGISP